MAEEDGVQVHGQDFALGVQPLYVNGGDLLADLAGIARHRLLQRRRAPLGAHLLIQVTGQLLGQGAGSLGRHIESADIGEYGPYNSPQVNAPVGEETAVLDGGQCVLHGLWDFLVTAENLAVLLLEIPQVLPVGRVHLGNAFGLEQLQLVDIGQVVAEQLVDHCKGDAVE